jgi:hypothetical protein
MFRLHPLALHETVRHLVEVMDMTTGSQPKESPPFSRGKPPRPCVVRAMSFALSRNLIVLEGFQRHRQSACGVFC